MHTRYSQVRADGERILALVEENRELFRAERDSDVWRKYIEYIDDIVLDGFFNCIQCSLQYLLDNTDKRSHDMPPLIQAKLELQVGCCRSLPPPPPHRPI